YGPEARGRDERRQEAGAVACPARHRAGRGRRHHLSAPAVDGDKSPDARRRRRDPRATAEPVALPGGGPMRRRIGAELVGTFALVFAGTGAIVANDASGGAVTHVGVALTFGLVVLALVYALGDVSGAHLNPAVTLGFWAARRFPARDVPPYLAAQCG